MSPSCQHPGPSGNHHAAFAIPTPLRLAGSPRRARTRAAAMLSDVSRAYIFQASPYRAARDALSQRMGELATGVGTGAGMGGSSDSGPHPTTESAGVKRGSSARSPRVASGSSRRGTKAYAPTTGEDGPRFETLDELYEFLARDDPIDPLLGVGGRVVLSRGSAQARLAIIGEAPGEQEDISGRPFVGPAGQLLDKIFTYGGFDMDSQVYVTNVVKRRPPGNRTPNAKEIHHYLPLLMEELRIVDPAVVVLAGSVATRAVLGAQRAPSITRVRGKWFSGWGVGAEEEAEESTEGNPWIMPVYHPSHLLRMPIKKFEMVTDIHAIRDKYLEVVPDDKLRPLDVKSRAS